MSKTMKFIVAIISVVLAISLIILWTKKGPSNVKMLKTAKQSLKITVENPDQLRIYAVSKTDSAFGAYCFSNKEINDIMKNMRDFSEKTLARTRSEKGFNLENPSKQDRITMKMMEQSMQSGATLRTILNHSRIKKEFSGYKMKIDYSCIDFNGVPYKSERWFYFDKKGKSILFSFDIAMP